MTMIFELAHQRRDGRMRMIEGICAKCGSVVFESEFILSDTYNVWAGRCWNCRAINFLSLNHGLRGYDSRKMYLVLPTDEEKKANNLPDDCPTCGSRGPATASGSPLNQFLEKIFPKKGGDSDA